YHGYRADVTSIVAGGGTYAFSNLSSANTSPFFGGCLAGATLVVIYDTTESDPNALNRIEIFDGFEGIRGAGLASGGGSASATLPLNLEGADLSFMTALSWQGNSLNEGSTYRDSLTVNGTPVFNTNNPINDYGNGSGANRPQNSVYAVDADTFNISFVNGATSLNIINSSVEEDYVISQAFVIGARGADISDAPNDAVTYNYGIARHAIIPSLSNPNLKLGSLIDSEVVDNDYAGTLGADFDDNNYTNNDEDSITSFPALTSGDSSYSINNIPVSNSTGGAAYLVGWIDFDNNGTFDNDEFARTTVANGATTANLNWSSLPGITDGPTYARFRLTSDSSIASATNAVPAGLASDGEVEDYRIAIATSNDPEMLLVKRITAINGDRTTNPNDSTALDQFVDDTTSSRAAEDNNAAWPANYLVGAFDAGMTRPGDEIEYTVYFLNSGDVALPSTVICDRIIGEQTIVLNAYGIGQDIEFQLGTNAVQYFTYASDIADRAEYFADSTTAPTDCSLNAITGGIADNGTWRLALTGTGSSVQSDLSALPSESDAPVDDSYYGYMRFRTRINE
ncbi:MAG: GEVED domain-containing protein, partial [Phormidesmis sp.]